MHNFFPTLHLYAFSNYTVSLLEDLILPSLTAQQKRILLVASVALSCLAIGYAIYRHCFFKAEVVSEGKEEEEVDEANLSQDSDDVLAAQLHDHEKSKAISLNKRLAMAKRAGALLTSLNLEDTAVTDHQLKEVMKVCPNLKTLDLSHCNELTDAIIKDLARSLETLDLSYCKQITEAAAKDLPPNLKGLTIEPGSRLFKGVTKVPIKATLINADYLRRLKDPEPKKA